MAHMCMHLRALAPQKTDRWISSFAYFLKKYVPSFCSAAAAA